MNRLLAGGVVAGLAGLASFAVATPGFAQADDPDVTRLTAVLDPRDADAGETITVAPEEGDECAFFEDGPSTGTLEWVVLTGNLGWEDFIGGAQPVLSGSVPLDENGSWEVSFEAPAHDPELTGTPVDFSSIPEPWEVYGPNYFEVTTHLGGGGGRSAVTGDKKKDDYVWKAICNPDLDEEVPPTTTTPEAPTTTTPGDDALPPPAVPIPDEPELTG